MMYLKLVSNLFTEAFGPPLHSKAGLEAAMLKHIGLQTGLYTGLYKQLIPI